MRIHLIWAQDEAGGIGKDGKLAWHCPEDLRRFKELTHGHTIVMGSKTWSTCLKERILPERINLILSRTGYRLYDLPPGCRWVQTTGQAMAIASHGYGKGQSEQQLWVIGGREVYEAFLPHATDVWITQIKGMYGCDTFAPPVPAEQWQLATMRTLSEIATQLHFTRL